MSIEFSPRRIGLVFALLAIPLLLSACASDPAVKADALPNPTWIASNENHTVFEFIGLDYSKYFLGDQKTLDAILGPLCQNSTSDEHIEVRFVPEDNSCPNNSKGDRPWGCIERSLTNEITIKIYDQYIAKNVAEPLTIFNGTIRHEITHACNPEKSDYDINTDETNFEKYIGQNYSAGRHIPLIVNQLQTSSR